jgi:hypothetical protein
MRVLSVHAEPETAPEVDIRTKLLAKSQPQTIRSDFGR